MLAARWTERWWAGWVVGLLWAAHPVHVEVAGNVVGRAEILAGIFSVVTLLLWLRWRANATPRRIVVIGLCILLAGLGKEHGYLAAGMLMAMEAGLLIADRVALRWRQLWSAYWRVMLAISLVASLAMTQRLVMYLDLDDPIDRITAEMDNPLQWATGSERVVTPFKIIGKATQLLVMPVGQSPDYSPKLLMPTHQMDDPLVLLGMAVVAAWLGALVYAWRRRSPALGPLLCCAIAWFVPSNSLVLIGTIFGERLLTMVSLIVLIAITALLPHRFSRGALVLCGGSVIGVLLMAFIGVTWVWWEPVIREQPTMTQGWAWRQALLGAVCLAGMIIWVAMRGRWAPALLVSLMAFAGGWATNFYGLMWRHGDTLTVYTVTTHPKGGRFQAYMGLHLAYRALYQSEIADDPARRGTMIDLAELHAVEADRLWPRQSLTYGVLGLVAEERGDKARARALYKLAGRGEAKWGIGDYGLVRLGDLDRLDDLQTAADDLVARLRDDPLDDGSRRELAEIYVKLRQFDEAAEQFEQIFSFETSDAELLNRYLDAALGRADLETAMTLHLRWIALEPDNWVALTDAAFLAVDLGGHLDEVPGWLDRAMAISPGSAEPWAALGGWYRVKGRPADAERAFREAIKRAPRDDPKHMQYKLLLEQLLRRGE